MRNDGQVIGCGSPAKSDLCQIDGAPAYSRLRRPGWLYVPYRILENLKKNGLRHTFRRTVIDRIGGLACRAGLRPAPSRVTPACNGEVLGLAPGDWVEVKPYEEIFRTLDGYGRHRGLSFTPEMRRHCGRRYRVFKRLALMFDENTREQRRLRNTVLLEGSLCSGDGIGCDRSCFLYWREAWLRRIPPPQDRG